MDFASPVVARCRRGRRDRYRCSSCMNSSIVCIYIFFLFWCKRRHRSQRLVGDEQQFKFSLNCRVLNIEHKQMKTKLFSFHFSVGCFCCAVEYSHFTYPKRPKRSCFLFFSFLICFSCCSLFNWSVGGDAGGGETVER